MSKILFLAIILISCAGNNEATGDFKIKPDSIKENIYLELLNMRMQVDTIKAMDSIHVAELDYKRRTIDTLIKKAIQYKDNKLEMQLISNKMAEINTENRAFFKNIEKLNKENQKLNEQNLIISNELQIQKRDFQKIKTEKSKLENSINEASRLTIAGVRISAIGYTKPLFGKPKAFETNKADKATQVDVSFSIAENKLSKRGIKIIATLVYANAKEDNVSQQMEINYNGKETPIKMTVGKGVEYKTGGHPVEIFIDDYMVYTGNLELK